MNQYDEMKAAGAGLYPPPAVQVPMPPKESPVIQAITRLENNNIRLQNLLDSLEARLESVLGGSVADLGRAGQQAAQPHPTKLLGAINQQADTQDRGIERLGSLIERIVL